MATTTAAITLTSTDLLSDSLSLSTTATLTKAGGAVVFPSDRFHNVSEVTSGTRYTMPIWWSKNERYLNL